MDWSADIPVTILPPPYVPLAEVHIPSPCVSLLQISTSGNIRSEPSGSDPVLLNYSNSQPLDPSSWDGVFQVVFLFEAKETLSKDTKNINISLIRIAKYIKDHLVSKERPSAVIGSLWDLINNIYTLEWDVLIFD